MFHVAERCTSFSMTQCEKLQECFAQRFNACAAHTLVYVLTDETFSISTQHHFLFQLFFILRRDQSLTKFVFVYFKPWRRAGILKVLQFEWIHIQKIIKAV